VGRRPNRFRGPASAESRGVACRTIKKWLAHQDVATGMRVIDLFNLVLRSRLKEFALVFHAVPGLTVKYVEKAMLARQGTD